MFIEEYKFGYLRINGVEYRRDLIVFPDKVIPDWWRKRGHRLSLDDVREVIEYNPEILVIGTGASGAMKVSGEVMRGLEGVGIEVITLITNDAIKEYNKLLGEGCRVAAGLHLTC